MDTPLALLNLALYQFSVTLHLIISNKRLYNARVPAHMFAKY